MTKIKYIHSFGTSYTAGGGFEFESLSEYRRDFLKSMYGHLDENFTQYTFSYPGQLQKLLGKDIKVFNHGKNGYGNELLYRKVYDIVTGYKFNPSENVFLIELSALGRKEFWLNEINDYVIVNYKIDWDSNKYVEITGIASSYWYDSAELESLLETYYDLFDSFFKKTYNLDNIVKQMWMNIEYLIAYLEKYNVNFYLMNDHLELENVEKNKINFGDGTYFLESTDFIRFSEKNKLTITDETNGRYIDGHNGYISNKIVAENVYNKLIDDLLIEKSKININWKKYKNFNLETQRRAI
jgi:hypothetical protein